MKPRIVLPRRAQRRISYLYGPPFPSEAGWVWADRRAQLERRSRHTGIERRVRQREEALFRTLFEVAPDAVVVLDRRGAVVVANRECERLFGYRREELLGEPVELLLPERYWAAYLSQREQYAAQPRPLRLEPEGRRRDGSEFPMEITLSPLETPQRQLVFAVIRDVTAQRQAVEVLKREVQALAEAKARLEAELRTANADLQRFGLVAARHLQQPLQQVGAHLSELESRCQGKLDREARKLIALAIDTGQHMNRLVDELLAYFQLRHRRPQLPPHPIEAAFILQQALAKLQPALAGSGGQVTHTALPPVIADPERLQLLFRHLIDNSLKFSGADFPRIHVAAEERGDMWVFSVRDNGIGIAPACYERIFRPFQRLHRREAHPGIGIGLTLCKRIVEQHGGRIWVESEVGRGATFYFSLPKRPPAPTGAQ